MRQALALLKFGIFLYSVTIFSVSAQTVESLTGKKEAQLWLEKIQRAAQKLNYSGTFVYQQGSQIRTSRIVHVVDGKAEVEKLEILDGKPREYIRNNEEIICYVPEAKILLIEKRVTRDGFPGILATNTADLSEYYNVKKGGVGRVAGHVVQSIRLEPKDNLRYGYQLWAEQSVGLLLHAQTLNEKNEVIEQITFTQISIGNVSKNQAKPSFLNTSGWHVENASMSQANLSGWTVKSIPPGFKKIREVTRVVSDGTVSSRLPLGSAGSKSSSLQNARHVSQIVFSDGLAAISVFIEADAQARAEGSMQQGAMNIIGKRQGDIWLTIVGEVPFAALKQVANSIEFNAK